MDAKALAKSKRAHSLHHSKKPHYSQKSKASTSEKSGDAGNGNKALGKDAKEKARQSALPSNWDRYEEEFDLGSKEPSGDSMNKGTDVVLPKSNGADYRHLIAEAHSLCQYNACLDSFPSLDDILPGDIKFGLGPMLSVRGEGILSWIGDDNFVVEDETTANPEAQFLSLNLNALAEQLEKVNLSKRLFIEADLLSPELADDHRSTKSDSPESDPVQARATFSEELALGDLSEENKVTNQNTEVVSSWSTVSSQTNFISLNQGLDILSQTKGDLYSERDSKSSQNGALGNPTEFNASSVAVPDKKLSTFEAAAAEVELDMLLDSFSEAKLLDSPGFTSGTFPASKEEAPTARPQMTRTGSSSWKPTSVARLDDVLDDLLEETANLSNQDGTYQLGKATANSSEIRSSSQFVSKSKVLDDFDSWLDTI